MTRPGPWVDVPAGLQTHPLQPAADVTKRMLAVGVAPRVFTWGSTLPDNPAAPPGQWRWTIPTIDTNAGVPSTWQTDPVPEYANLTAASVGARGLDVVPEPTFPDGFPEGVVGVEYDFGATPWADRYVIECTVGGITGTPTVVRRPDLTQWTGGPATPLPSRATVAAWPDLATTITDEVRVTGGGALMVDPWRPDPVARTSTFTWIGAFASTWVAYRYRLIHDAGGAWRTRQRQALAGADGWPLRQRQQGVHSGSWPLRQRQRGI